MLQVRCQNGDFGGERKTAGAVSKCVYRGDGNADRSNSQVGRARARFQKRKGGAVKDERHMVDGMCHWINSFTFGV